MTRPSGSWYVFQRLTVGEGLEANLLLERVAWSVVRTLATRKTRSV
jgi:hypothetical protein